MYVRLVMGCIKRLTHDTMRTDYENFMVEMKKVAFVNFSYSFSLILLIPLNPYGKFRKIINSHDIRMYMSAFPEGGWTHV